MITVRWRALAAIWCLACASAQPSAASGRELRPFAPGSMQTILAAHRGEPFVLAMWSLSCAYCQEELKVLSGLVRAHPNLGIVLISTDTPQESQAIVATLSRHRLPRAEAWVFGDTFVERLRYEVDPTWRGELPRSYLYGADGRRQAFSGGLSRQTLEHWVAQTTATDLRGATPPKQGAVRGSRETRRSGVAGD